MSRSDFALLALASALLLAGCGDAPPAPGGGPHYGLAPVAPAAPVYRFAIHPLHNPTKLSQYYQPLVDHINASLTGAQVTLEASRDYASFEEKYRKQEPEIILPNPWQTIQAMKHGYHVLAIAGEPDDFRGIILVRRDSGITKPADLKGKAVSYPSPTALAACIMPQYYLHEHGLDIGKDLDNRYVGSQESSILNVLQGLTAAGATWPPPWRAFQKEHPEQAAALQVAWETEPLINNSVMMRDSVPQAIQTQFRQILTTLHDHPQGKPILANMGTARFIPASDRNYDVVRAYVDRFELAVRKVESR
jgi:phosphonate transport system substrate-binding protein